MKKALILILFLTLLPINSMSAIETGELIKGESFSAVYYKAVDGKRYVFPNQRIYNSWYADFSGVNVITDGELFDLALGGNVFYKPNSRLVKITTDPKVYWVDEFGILRHVVSEAVAEKLFGSDWINKVDDLPDEFFTGYTIGNSIDADFQLEIYENWVINDNQKLTQRGKDLAAEEKEVVVEEPEEIPEEVIVDEGQQPENINLTVTTVYSNQDATFEWFVSGGNTKYGFIVLKSKTDTAPTYNLKGNFVKGEDYDIVYDITANAYIWENLENGGAYYFRVCRRNSDGSCGTYSDVESALIGASSLTPTITLSGVVEDGVVKLSWKKQWLSPNYGFYLMRDVNPNPVYPTHPYIWLSKEIESYNWTGLSKGMYHFRICRYKGSASSIYCEYYSNDLELTF